MEINKLLTKTNFRAASNREIKYIVIHYVGATGGAKDNCRYFETIYRGASAHYFVGHSGEIWQSILDKNIAWHCGTNGAYKHPYCRNDNSIGIELCCYQDKNGGWYFTDATVSSAIGLVKELMAKYNIPVENVIRHYDVTGKICPEPYVRDLVAWDNFKNGLKKEIVKVDNTPDNYAKEAVEWAIKQGLLKGNDKGDYMLHSAISRQDMLVLLFRAIGQE